MTFKKRRTDDDDTMMTSRQDDVTLNYARHKDACSRRAPVSKVEKME